MRTNREPSEVNLHQRCYTFFHNKYPKLRKLLNYNLNNSPDARSGAINKSLGLQKGRSDLTLYYKGTVYHIELKTKTGKQSKAQEEFEDIMESHGFNYYIIRSLEEFKALIDKII